MDNGVKRSRLHKVVMLLAVIIAFSGIVMSTALFSDYERATMKITANYPSYVVSYDANGGHYEDSAEINKVRYEDGSVIEGEYKEPTREETYLFFDGWYTEPECKDGNEFDPVEDTKDLDKDITVYAKWSYITYKVIYNANGGEGEMEPSEHVYNVEKALTENAFTREGHDFINWNTEPDGTGTSYTDCEVVKNLVSEKGKVVNLYAQWKIRSYTYDVIYKTESGIELGTDQITREHGHEETVYPKDFEGYTKPDPQDVVWDTEEKTIIFIYTPIEYTITYILNGGTVATANPTTYTVETPTFTLNNPTKEMHIFEGWTGSNGTTPDTEVKVEKGSTGNKTFTANWEKIPPVLRSWTWDDTDDFHADEYRYNITTAEMVDSAEVPENIAAGPWDVSDERNGTVTAWLIKTGEDDTSTPGEDETTYHLTIAGNGYGKIFANVDSSYAFYAMENMDTFEGLPILDTVNAETMEGMFAYCEKVSTLDVAGWNTGKVKSLNYTFAGCKEMDTLDVSTWNISETEDLSGTFYDCWDLQGLNLEGWDVSNVKYMDLTFGTDLASSLTTIGDVSEWNTSNVESMALMFYDCYELLGVDVSQWDTSKVTDMESMFYGCEKLTVLDVSQWNTAKVEDMSEMFRNCKELTVIDISGWDCSSLDYTTYNAGNIAMFQYCEALTELTIPASMSQLSASFARYCGKLNKITFNHTAEDALTLAGAGSNGPFRATEPYNSENMLETTLVTVKDEVLNHEWAKEFRMIKNN